MAIAVIGGVAVSTMMSLFVVPAFYVIMDRARGTVFGRLVRPRGWRGGEPEYLPRAGEVPADEPPPPPFA